MDSKLFEMVDQSHPLEIIKDDCGFASIFKTVGIVGDSLSSGEFESIDDKGEIHYHDMYEYSWPAVLERITGTKYLNFSRGGMSFKEFYESWADKNNFWQKCQAYILNLGNNDIFLYNQNIGSADDIDVLHPENNPDTYFGYMGKVICKLRSIEKDSRIFIVSLQLDHLSKEKDDICFYVLSEIQKVCKKFKYIYTIDITNYGPVYDEKAREKFAMGFHPNPMGYVVYAKVIGNHMDYLIRKHFEDFREIPFIGSDLKYYR